MVTIRAFTEQDVPFGLELCRIAGWNQLAADWMRLVKLAPDGVFVVEADGARCGTATAVCYDRRLAWIGMILVHPDFRGRGIGSRMMTTCIEHLHALGAAAIKVDATDQGRPVYLKLGFRDEQPIWRMIGRREPEASGAVTSRDAQASGAVNARDNVPPGVAANAAATAPGNDAQASGAVIPILPEHWPGIAALDRTAFDADRLKLLRALAAEGPAMAAVRGSQVQAFGFARPGYNAWQLGPVVSNAPEAAAAVVAALFDSMPAGKVFWDILPENVPAMRLAQSLGFEPGRKLVRMYLGADALRGPVEGVYAGAGFELG